MVWLLSPHNFYPVLSLGMQAIFLELYGILLLGELLLALPNWHRFFMSERWGGYAKSSLIVDCIQNPFVTFVVAVVWFACACAFISGQHTVAAAVLNVLFCRYFFVFMRWKGVLRGMGAPGFMTYWTALAVLLLELSTACAPSVRPLCLLVIQVDFALIMLSAGLYKLFAGYARNHGMEYGLVNPEWSFWPSLFVNVPPKSVLFKAMNHLAWGIEVVAAIFMLIPATRFVGGLLILFSFIFIATQIRLTLLAELVIVDCLIFFHPGSIGERLLLGLPMNLPHAAATDLSFIALPLTVCLTAYLILLPFAHMGLFFNFFARKTLPRVLQAILERYTNFFGLIIWRVFTVDVINFFIRIYHVDLQTNERTLISKYGWTGGFRFSHVGESIAITSLFTTLKYYSSQPDLFNERLQRYARTLGGDSNKTFLFEYVSIQKRDSCFSYVPIAEYTVSPGIAHVEERILDGSVSVRASHQVSPVREGVKPGSYVALGD